MSLVAATWNVNGLRARKDQVLDWLARERPGIVFLQEIKCRPEQVPADLATHPDYWSAWHGAGGYSGVAVLTRKERFPAPPKLVAPAFDFECRALGVDVGQFQAFALYVPNGGKDYEAKLRFLAALREFARQAARERRSLLLAGDLNVALAERDIHPKERKPDQIGARAAERELLGELLAADLLDVGRHFDPDNDALFTWWAPWRSLRQRNIGWRIDYVLASGMLREAASSASVRSEVGTSDHAPVVAEFAVD
jgi:exodeoxyribonuclease-3